MLATILIALEALTSTIPQWFSEFGVVGILVWHMWFTTSRLVPKIEAMTTDIKLDLAQIKDELDKR